MTKTGKISVTKKLNISRTACTRVKIQKAYPIYITYRYMMQYKIYKKKLIWTVCWSAYLVSISLSASGLEHFLFLPVFGRTIWTEIRQTQSTTAGTFCAHAYIRITKFINHRYLWRMSAISMPKPQSYAWHICKTKQEETRTGRHCRNRTSATSCSRIFGLLSEFFVTLFISVPVIFKCFTFL